MPVPSNWPQQFRAFVDEFKAHPHDYLDDKSFDRFVLTERAESWDQFLGWVNELQGSWYFRGQREAEWLLHTSLDRAVLVRHSSKYSSGYYHLDRAKEERDLLFRFQQQAHLYLRHPPARDDLSSWFALMQHHHAPTRFLDWTRTPYVAMYFAVEGEAKEKERRSTVEGEIREKERLSAVWAVDLDWLETKEEEVLHSAAATAVRHDPKARSEYVNGLLGQEKEESVILRIDPEQTDERMVAQQGVFLCSLVREAKVYQILMSMMIHPETSNRPVVRKLGVDNRQRIRFLRNLRGMNIHRASLFPGLDGVGESLKIDMEIKVTGKGEEPDPSISDLREMLSND